MIVGLVLYKNSYYEWFLFAQKWIYRKRRKFWGVKLSWFFNCGSEVKFRDFCGSYIVDIAVKWHYNYLIFFNCNTKVPSIGIIETETENGENVTRTNNIEVFLQLQPQSHMLQAITPLCKLSRELGSGHVSYLPSLSPCRHGIYPQQQNLVRNLHLTKTGKNTCEITC